MELRSSIPGQSRVPLIEKWCATTSYVPSKPQYLWGLRSYVNLPHIHPGPGRVAQGHRQHPPQCPERCVLKGERLPTHRCWTSVQPLDIGASGKSNACALVQRLYPTPTAA